MCERETQRESKREREKEQKSQSSGKLLAQSEQRQPSPCVSGFLNGVLTCPAVNKDQRLYSSSHCLPYRTPSVCLSVSLTEVSSDLPELIFYNRPGLRQLCQHFMSVVRTADFTMSGLQACMYSDSPVRELEGRDAPQLLLQKRV